MKIYRKSVAVKDLVEGYVDSGDEGYRATEETGYKTPYQREFI